ncbi:hypothetical protein FDZ71_00215 [bacterium]|nr:MAG: hypothetical protein FDZ71_00215 [bacterium]
MSVETIPDDRSSTLHERQLVDWMLRNASTSGDLSHLESGTDSLRVVGRCGCGCPSIDFAPGGQTPPAYPIADAYGADGDGVWMGVILWGTNCLVTGLEVYELELPVRSLPLLETMCLAPPD